VGRRVHFLRAVLCEFLSVHRDRPLAMQGVGSCRPSAAAIRMPYKQPAV